MDYQNLIPCFSFLKLLFEELLERAKEKEEKEAKKRQRLADDFTNLLYTLKVDEDSTMIWFIFHSFWLNGSLLSIIKHIFL